MTAAERCCPSTDPQELRRGHCEIAPSHRSLEPISYIGTCATEARWDAGRGGEPEAICRYCEGSRQRDAPRSPRPTRVAARTVGCCVALLDHIDIWPSSGALHPLRPGHNASRAYI